MANDHLSLMPLWVVLLITLTDSLLRFNLLFCLKTERKETVKILGSQATKCYNTKEIKKLVKYSPERIYKCQPNPICKASIFISCICIFQYSPIIHALVLQIHINSENLNMPQVENFRWQIQESMSKITETSCAIPKLRLRFYAQTQVISQKRKRTLFMTALKESRELRKSQTS